MIIISDENVIETKHFEDCIIIKVKDLKNVSHIDINKKKEQKIKNRQEKWGDFVTEFLSQDFVKDIPKDQKIRITRFIKNNLKI